MRPGIVLHVCFFLLLCVFRGFAQSFDYKENSVYVFNFIKYIDWSQKKPNITVGIVGKSPVEAELRNLVNRKKNSGFNLTIKSIEVNETRSVDVVIVAEKSSSVIREIDRLTQNLPILIISEKENQTRMGACISFFIDEENNFKTEYQLSVRNCRARGLIISEQILNNAVLTR